MKEQPALEVVEMSVAELVPYANNAKEHSARQVDAIAASIAEFGNCDPVAVWHNAKGEPEIVEGHGRVMALKKLGIDAVPVITLDHLTDAQRRAYTHVHNQTTLNSGFDMDVLDAELEELAAELDVDFEDFGFEEGFDAIGDMLAGEEFCSNSIEGAGVGDVGITFVFPEEHAETVKAYVNDVGKDEIAARIVREAQAWG